jgi:hypothetical protein
MKNNKEFTMYNKVKNSKQNKNKQIKNYKKEMEVVYCLKKRS